MQTFKTYVAKVDYNGTRYILVKTFCPNAAAVTVMVTLNPEHSINLTVREVESCSGISNALLYHKYYK